jgi:hypothetical protein
VIQEQRLKYLLMESCAVEACSHGQFHILDKCFLCRRCVNAIRIEALIQHQSLKHALIVDEEFLSIQSYLTHTKVAFYLIFSIG